MVYRELTPEEYENMPREVSGSERLNPDNSKTIAAINDAGEIVGTFSLFVTAHLEPVWIREDHRGKGMILGRMGNAMKALCRSMGITGAYTVVLEKTPTLAKFAVWFGAKPVDGTLYEWVDDRATQIISEE